MRNQYVPKLALVFSLAATVLSACAGGGRTSGELPSATILPSQEGPSEEYIIGPSDQLSIFVWRNPDLSTKVQVRPDGRITTPLVTDMPAVGKTTTMLAQDMKIALSEFIKDPIVSVIVDNPAGTFSQQVRIVGATTKPAAIPYRANMTLLDAMIAVGGLNDYASGNRARLVRIDRATGRQREYPIKINDLMRHGDARANVKLQPGDVIIIPQSAF
jgi:polysaccharide export outer membrane protein